MAQDFRTVGEAFVQHYYKVFDTNRAELASLYVSAPINNNHTWKQSNKSGSGWSSSLSLLMKTKTKREQSMLTFEGQQFLGTKSIVEKLTSLSFQSVAHAITTCDCQPVQSEQPNGVMVFVSGTMRMDQNNPMTFSQCFHLLKEGDIFWVANDMFRLNLA